MRTFGDIVMRFVVSGVAIALTALILPGIHVRHPDVGTFVILAIVVGLVNAILRPLLDLLTFPITFMTLGLSHLVINTILLYLVSVIDSNLVIDNILWAFLGAAILGVLGSILESIARATGLVEDKGKKAKLF